MIHLLACHTEKHFSSTTTTMRYHILTCALLVAALALSSAAAGETQFCKDERLKCSKRCEPMEMNFDCKVAVRICTARADRVIITTILASALSAQTTASSLHILTYYLVQDDANGRAVACSCGASNGGGSSFSTVSFKKNVPCSRRREGEGYCLMSNALRGSLGRQWAIFHNI